MALLLRRGAPSMTTPRHFERTGQNRGTNCEDVAPRAVQDLPRECAPGAHVAARGRTWIVTRVDRYARCGVVALASARSALSLIVPIDRIEAVAGRGRWRRARMGRVAQTVLTSMVGGTSFAPLRGGAAGLVLLPWQSAVASAFDGGAATRVLLADAVGLGKTIQAGLAVTALRARDPASRVLVLAPAGVRDQWADEWDTRLGLRAWVADPAACRRAGAELPAGVTPWAAHSLVVASIDYVKQPDVLAAALAVWWDLVIVDEAHNVGAGSDRRTAAHALASSSARVLLVTATPHAGQDEAFAALCAIGARGGEGDPCLVRRTRAHVGLGASARLRMLQVPPSASERRMHDTLRVYARQVWDEGLPGGALAMAWLLKRAASSPVALARSIAHRQAQLGGPRSPTSAAPWLPFDDEVDERDDADTLAPEALGAPGLSNADRERRLMDALATDALAACREWRKGLALARWLRRSREPAVVFTEYRDTLDALLPVLDGVAVAVLHGGRSVKRSAEEQIPLDGTGTFGRF